MWEALEQLGWVQTLNNTGWLYNMVSVTHYVTMFWFIGSIAIVDLRIMGLVAQKRTVRDVTEQLFPWAWFGFAISSFSGFLMFATDAGNWAPSPHFHIKLALIGVSVVFAIIVHASAKKWSETSETPVGAKLVAFLSLAFWIWTIVSASEIPAKEGLG